MSATPSTPRAPAPVLYVHYGDDWIRGSERGLLDLLAHVDRDRFQPVLWCNAPAMAEAARDLEVLVLTSPFAIQASWTRPRFDLPRYAALVREGRRLVKALRVGLVHASSGAPVQWMLPVARSAAIPLLAQLHCPYALRDRCTMGLTQVSLAAGISESAIAGLLEDGMRPERTQVIHYGVDLARLRDGALCRLRAELDLPGDALVATFVGSLIHRKGVDVLLRAVARLRESEPRVHLLVVGDGPERSALESLARELGVDGAVHFLGEREDVGSIYRDATDLAVSATRSEAFGLALIEASGLGLPVVATRVEGVPEAVDDGRTGLLVPPDDPEALAAAIARLARDPELRERLGAAGRQRVETEFTIPRYVEEFEKAYEQLLGAPRSRYGWLGPWTPPSAPARWLTGALRRRWTRPPLSAPQASSPHARPPSGGS